jgi:hypothetical protein
MIAKVLIVAVALFAVAVIAQHPRHCDAPREFEAHVYEWDRKENWGLGAHFFYDAHLERTASFDDVVNGTTEDYFHIIHLPRERREYRINLQTQVCTTTTTDRPFRRIEIPRDAKFRGDAIVGTNAFPDSGVLTTHWEMHGDSPKFEWYGVYTDRDVGCIPVMDHFHDDNVGTVETRFFDVVLGIGDPNVFIPPSSCPRPANAEHNHF